MTCTEANEILKAAAPAMFSKMPGLRIVSEAPDTPTEIVGTGGGARPAAIDSHSRMWTADWHGERPSSELVAAWTGGQLRGALECGADATFEGRPVVSAEKAQEMRSAASVPNVPTFARVSAPILDHSGTHALIYLQGDGPGGRSEFFHVRRADGTWKVVGSIINAVS